MRHLFAAHATTPRSGARPVAATALASCAVLTLAFGASYARAWAGQTPNVARVSSVAGNVTIGNEASQSIQARVNVPVLSGQYLSTANESRAEVQLDYADALRAASYTRLRFTNLDGIGDTVQLATGTIELRALRASNDHPLIETPSVTVRPREPGAYLVSVTQDGSTQITVRSGEADIVTPGGSRALRPGRTMLATGNANDPQFTYIATAPYDGFEQWNDGLDRQLAQTGAYQYVNQYVIGANDLDEYGSWNDIPGYGECWHPNEYAGWAPYQNGMWITNNYYGPTWVGYEPWGWAPYHYGRWFYTPRVGWSWDPGRRVVRPLWSPALVGFFGFTAGGIQAGAGNVGWVPLAPGETLHPWWGPHRNTTTIDNHVTIANGNPGWQRRYANFRAPHAISGVPLATWNQGNVRRVVSFDPRQIRTGRTLPGAPRIVHVQSSAARRNTPTYVPGARAFVPVAQPVEQRAPTVAPGWRTFDSSRTGAPAQPHLQRFTPPVPSAPQHDSQTGTYEGSRAYPMRANPIRTNPSRVTPPRAYHMRANPPRSDRAAPRHVDPQVPQHVEQRRLAPRPRARPSAPPNGARLP